VQVTGDPRALLRDGEPRPLVPQAAQLLVRPDRRSERRRHRADAEHRQRPGGDGRVVRAGDGQAHPHDQGGGHGQAHRRRDRQGDAGRGDHVAEQQHERPRGAEREHERRQARQHADGAAHPVIAGERPHRREQREVQRRERGQQHGDRGLRERRQIGSGQVGDRSDQEQQSQQLAGPEPPEVSRQPGRPAGAGSRHAAPTPGFRRRSRTRCGRWPATSSRGPRSAPSPSRHGVPSARARRRRRPDTRGR
jgi:hypothetical protein